MTTEIVENSGTITGGTGGESAASIQLPGSTSSIPGSSPTAQRRCSISTTGSGTTSDIDNEGTITGSGYAIVSESDILDINNSGTIHGGLYSTSSVDVENSGHWHDGTGTGGHVFLLYGAGNSITNSQAGTITGAISIGGTGGTIDNAGRIDGAITLPGGDVFTNTGEIDGAVTFTGTKTNNTFTNSGAITGNLTLSNSAAPRSPVRRLPTPVRSQETSPRSTAGIR